MRGVIHTCVTSVNSNSTYLVKNRFGVYYFQRRLPLDVQKRSPSLTKLVRLSLRTKSKKEALRLVRLLLVMWDSKAKKYFKTKKDYEDGMDLLFEFKKKMTFEDAQDELLDSMDEWDDYLLNQATDLYEYKAFLNGDNSLLNEIKEIKKSIDQIRISNKSSSVNSISMDEAFDNFVNQRKNAWKKNSFMENSFRMSYYPILKASTGEIKTGDITKQHINDFLTIILNLPANKTKISAYKNQPITNFIKNKIPEKDQISQSTKQKYIRAIGSFLKW